MDWFTIISLTMQYGPLVKNIIDESLSNDDIVTKIQKLAGPLAPILEQLGGQLFPQAKPALHIAAAAMATFNPSATKSVQGALNILLVPSPNLTVDGINGPKTRAAVKAYQVQLGLDADGWVGLLTRSAIDAAMAARLTSVANTPAA